MRPGLFREIVERDRGFDLDDQLPTHPVRGRDACEDRRILLGLVSELKSALSNTHDRLVPALELIAAIDNVLLTLGPMSPYQRLQLIDMLICQYKEWVGA